MKYTFIYTANCTSFNSILLSNIFITAICIFKDNNNFLNNNNNIAINNNIMNKIPDFARKPLSSDNDKNDREAGFEESLDDRPQCYSKYACLGILFWHTA